MVGSYTDTLLNTLEKIHRRASKCALGNIGQDMPYEERLKFVKRRTLEKRWLFLLLIECYKIISNHWAESNSASNLTSITKSDDRAAGVRFVHHEYHYRPSWTTRSLITESACYIGSISAAFSSPGSFPEQRLVIEPSFYSQVHVLYPVRSRCFILTELLTYNLHKEQELLTRTC